MANQIKVKIFPDGSTEIKVEGVSGGKCKDLTKNLEKALGKTTSDKKTNEFFKNEEQGIQAKLKR